MAYDGGDPARAAPPQPLPLLPPALREGGLVAGAPERAVPKHVLILKMDKDLMKIFPSKLLVELLFALATPSPRRVPPGRRRRRRGGPGCGRQRQPVHVGSGQCTAENGNGKSIL